MCRLFPPLCHSEPFGSPCSLSAGSGRRIPAVGNSRPVRRVRFPGTSGFFKESPLGRSRTAPTSVGRADIPVRRPSPCPLPAREGVLCLERSLCLAVSTPSEEREAKQKADYNELRKDVRQENKGVIRDVLGGDESRAYSAERDAKIVSYAGQGNRGSRGAVEKSDKEAGWVKPSEADYEAIKPRPK